MTYKITRPIRSGKFGQRISAKAISTRKMARNLRNELGYHGRCLQCDKQQHKGLHQGTAQQQASIPRQSCWNRVIREKPGRMQSLLADAEMKLSRCGINPAFPFSTPSMRGNPALQRWKAHTGHRPSWTSMAEILWRYNVIAWTRIRKLSVVSGRYQSHA